MKKLLAIMVLGLLIASCDNIGSSKTTFKDCYFKGEKDDNLFDEHSFEIDKDNKTIVRTMVWNEEQKKVIEKIDKKKIPKIIQENLQIVSIGAKYMTAKHNDGREYVFNLSNKTVELNFNDDVQIKIICK